MTREAKAIELLHRVLNYFLGGIAFPEKMELLLDEIEAFLTEIEAEEAEMVVALKMMVEMVEMNGFGKHYALDLAKAVIGRGEE